MKPRFGLIAASPDLPYNKIRIIHAESGVSVEIKGD